MQKFTINCSLSAPIGNIKRKKHVLIIPQLPDGSFYIGEKKQLYPTGIYRFIGGGVEKEETPLASTIRELQEELQLDCTNHHIEQIAEIEINAKTSDETYQLRTYLFKVAISATDQLIPSDDISGIRHMQISELPGLVEKYTNLKQDNMLRIGDYQQSWGDYGKVYGPIHQIAYDLLSKS